MPTRAPDADAAPRRSEGPLALVKQLRGEGLAAIDAERHEALGSAGTGSQPHGLAVAPGGRWGYVPYAGSNAVEAVDLGTLEVAGRVDAGEAPVGAALGRGGDRLFVSTYGGLPGSDDPGVAVFAVDGGDVTYSDGLPLGRAAGIVVDARNHVWVALKDGDQVVRFDAAPPHTELDRIDVPEEPQELSHAPAAGLIGVDCVGGDAVTLLDVRDGAPIGTVSVPEPRGGTAVPRCDRWFVGEGEGVGLTAVDVAALRRGDGGAVERVPLGTATAYTDATPDGELVAVDAYDDDRVTFLDPASLDVVTRPAVGATPRHPRFAPDGAICHVACVDDDAVAVLDVDAVRAGDDPTIATIELPEGSGPAGCFRTDRR